MGATRAIDWGTAQRVGELVAGSPRNGGRSGAGSYPPTSPSHPRAASAPMRPPAPAHSAQSLAHDFAGRVSAYTGLELPDELPPLEMVDRPEWIAANLLTMRPLLDPLVEQLGAGDGGLGLLADRGFLRSTIGGPLREAPGHLLGAQLGAVTGLLSQRVLGQYDVSLLDAQAPPRLLLLAPNLASAAHNLAVDRDELIAWVAIHEITHAVQFSGAPWLREHLGGMLRQLIDGMRTSMKVGELKLSELKLGDPRELIARARRGELLRLGLGEERWKLVEQMQATMSLIEGHAEHTMDAVGAEVLPSLPRLRAALTRRRQSRPLPWRVLERVLGLELKMRQYEVGRRFCDTVVQAGGPELLALAWRSASDLPTSEELGEPGRWIDRMRVTA